MLLFKGRVHTFTKWRRMNVTIMLLSSDINHMVYKQIINENVLRIWELQFPEKTAQHNVIIHFMCLN